MPLLTLFLWFIVLVIVICVVGWIVQRLVTAFNVQEPVKTVIYVVLALLFLVLLIGVLLQVIQGHGTFRPY